MSEPQKPASRSEIVWPSVSAALALIGIIYIQTSYGGAVGYLVAYAVILALLAVSQTVLLRIRRLEPGLVGVALLTGTLTGVLTDKGVPVLVSAAAAVVVVVPPFAFISGRLALTRSPVETAAVSLIISFALSTLAAVLVDSRGLLLPRSGTMDFLWASTAGLPNFAIAGLIIVFLLGLPLSKHSRRINSDTAIDRRAVMLLYLGATLLSGVGGIVLVVNTRYVLPSSISMDWVEVEILAAMLIGGASLYGGRGSLWTAMAGSFFVQTVYTLLNIHWVDPSVVAGALGLIASIGFYIDYRSRQSKASTEPYAMQTQ